MSNQAETRLIGTKGKKTPAPMPPFIRRHENGTGVYVYIPYTYCASNAEAVEHVRHVLNLIEHFDEPMECPACEDGPQ